MAKIKIYGDSNKGCIFFDGSRVEPKFLGTITASIKADETDRIVIQRTDVFQRDGVSLRTLFKRLKATRVQNKDGENLIDDLGYSVQDVVVYINGQASNYSAGGAIRPELDEHPNFVLDNTSTTIMVDNGENFAVNTLKAVLGTDGLVDIVSSDHSDNAIVHYEDCPPENLQINGSFIPGGPQDVVNALNELFTVGAFESVVISDPYATMVADVDGTVTQYTLEGNTAIDPEGNDIFTNTSSGNYAGLKTVDTIDQAGEYFTFDIRGEGQIGFGLIHSDASYAAAKYQGNANYADPDTFAISNSAHYGWQFSHWFHPTPNGSWTNYGANTSYSIKSGWYNWDQKQDWIDGNPVKIRVGLDANGFISIESLQNDGTWVVHVRTSYPVPEGAEFHLGVKAANASPRVYSVPKVHLLEPAAPTMYFRYIESPDGYYSYPLFATQEEADYYELTESGADNGSHTHVYPDDPTNTTWYMPNTAHEMNYGMSPTEQVITFDGNPINWTEITSLTNADLAPPAFADTTITVDELSLVNYQLAPVDVGYVTSIGGTPNWSLAGGHTLLGIAPEVAGDNVANPSDTTTVTVYRTNSYGTSSGTLTINITNLTAPVVTPIAGVTHEGGAALVDSDTMDAGSVISIDDVVEVGNRVVLDKEWLDNYVLPAITSGTGSKSVWVGFVAQGVTPDYSSISNADFRIAYEFNCDDASRAGNYWRIRTHGQGASYANIGIGGTHSGLYDYVFINEGTHVRSGCLVASQGHDASTKVFDPNDAAWNWTLYNTSSGGSQDLIIATQNTQLDISLSEFNEYSEPNPAPAILTPWNKALDFSGSNEYAVNVDTSQSTNPTRQAPAVTIAPPTDGQTVNSGRPWATACVFRIDGNSSNQHIWNQGEGSGGSDDNIYLRVDAAQNLYFGWGRQGELNEVRIATAISPVFWYGVYVGYNGTRWASAGATAGNLYKTFDIRLMSGHDSFATSQDVGGYANWIQPSSTTGGRMDRSVDGYFSVGGRRTNRSFHGKVASMVRTTLLNGVAMPDTAEIEMMVTDPLAWKNTYKAGSQFRQPQTDTGSSTWDNANATTKGRATQIWLMGDGGNDSYSNMIRNRINSADQNDNKLNMISMVSNDIQNVTIPGLS